MPLPQNTPGLPLAIPFGAVRGLALQGLSAAFQTNPQLQPLQGLEPILNNFFATYAGPAGVTGSLFPYTLLSAVAGNPQPFDFSGTGSGNSRLQTIDQFEFGYTGVILSLIHI